MSETQAQVRLALEREAYFKKKLLMDRAKLIASVPFVKDADISAFQLELTAVETDIITHFPQDTTSRKMFKVFNIGKGPQSIGYRELLRTGQAQFTGYGDQDVPRANVSRAETFHPIRKGKIQYGWELEDVEAMDFTGFSLSREDGFAAKDGMEYLFNNTAYFGDTTKGLSGFFSYATTSNPSGAIALNVVTPVAGLSVGADNTWATKLPEEILNDVINLKLASGIATKGKIKSNVLGVGVEQYGLLQYSYFNGMGTGESVMDRIMKKGIFDRVEECPELNGVTISSLGITNKNIAIAISDRTDVFKLQHPLEFTPLPLQISGFSFKVFCHGNTAGLMMYQKYGGTYLNDI